MSTHPTMVLRASLLVPLVTAVVVGGATAAQAAPVEDDPPELVVGLEGSHAALVRIETGVQATAIFIDHSTGEVMLHRVDSNVLQGSATGVVTSADGVVATLNRELTLDESRVRPVAVNRLFVQMFNAQLQGGNETTQRTHATDPEVDHHLQECYDRTDVCLVYGFPQYTVIPQSTDQHRTPATVLNAPSGPTGVALLRIGGSALPTAELADAAAATEEALVTGLDRGPGDGGGTSDWAPVDEPVAFDGQALQPGPDTDLAGRLQAGATGGPLIDATSGQVLGLVDWDPASSTPTVVGVDAVQTALAESDLEAAGSPFDVAFERGLKLLGDGDYAAARSELDKAIAYFDSLPAERFRQTADDRAGPAAAAESSGAPADRTSPWVWVGIIVLVVIVLGALALWLLRRRGRSRPAADDDGTFLLGDQSTPPGSGAYELNRAGNDGWPSQPSVSATSLVPDPAGLSGDAARAAPAPAPSVVMTRDRPPVPSAPGIQPAAQGAPGMDGSEPGTSPRQAFCIRCGTRLASDGAFCGGCGAPVRRV
jgi:hypothetical protein